MKTASKRYFGDFILIPQSVLIWTNCLSFSKIIKKIFNLKANYIVYRTWLEKNISDICILGFSVLFLGIFVVLFSMLIPSNGFNVIDCFNHIKEVLFARSPNEGYNPLFINAKIECLKGIGTLIGGLIGLLTLTITILTYKAERRKSLQLRYEKATDQLNNDSLAVRVGAITTLETLMNEAPEQFAKNTIDLLCAYSTEHGKRTNEASVVDLKKAATIICKTPHWILHHNEPLQLQNVNWEKFDLGDACNLEGANLSGANLQLVNFSGTKTNLNNTIFDEANLSNANLQNCSLKNAKFQRAQLENTCLDWSELVGSDFQNANLQCARLSDANLTTAVFTHAQLQNAFLNNAIMVATSFYGANLEGAYFCSEQIKYCCFSEVKLSNNDQILGGRIILTLNAPRNIESNPSNVHDSRCVITLSRFRALQYCLPLKKTKSLFFPSSEEMKEVQDPTLWESDPSSLSDDEIKLRLNPFSYSVSSE
jgi:uncharacterized protein YjbI with pentapeptide repeats